MGGEWTCKFGGFPNGAREGVTPLFVPHESPVVGVWATISRFLCLPYILKEKEKKVRVYDPPTTGES